jgi:hypothetical protein
MNFDLDRCGPLETLDKHNVHGRELCQQFAQVRFWPTAQFTHERPTIGGGHQNLRGACASMLV